MNRILLAVAFVFYSGLSFAASTKVLPAAAATTVAAAAALPIEPIIPISRLADAFVKLTCVGITTPGGGNDAVVFTPLLTVHFPASTRAPYPSVAELRNANPNRFKFITAECNKRRYERTTFPSGKPVVWPDWGNDRKYQKLEISEVVMPPTQIGRSAGSPCQLSSQCARFLSCNANTNTCDGLTSSTPVPVKDAAFKVGP